MKKITFTFICFFIFLTASAQYGTMDDSFGQYHTGAARMYFRNNEDEVNAIIDAGTYHYIGGSTQKYNGNWDFVFGGFYGLEYAIPTYVGRTYVDFDGGDDHATAMVKGIAQTEGRIYMAGYTTNGGVTKFAVARLSGGGSYLQTAFSDDGKVTTAIGAIDDRAFAIAPLSDGKTLVAGYTTTAVGKDFAIVRYLEDGSLDTTFGTNGIVITDFNGGDDQVNAIVVLSSGKILAGGFATVNGQKDFAVARYNTNGTLDTTFNTTGKLTTNLNADDSINALAVDTVNNVVYGAGATGAIGNLDVAILKYGTNGLSTSFDTDGILTTAVGSYDDVAYGLIYKDNGLFISGYSYNGTYKKALLAKYSTTSAALEPTFGTNGLVVQSIGEGDDVAKGLIFKPSELEPRIYIAGTGFNGCNNDAFLTEFSPSGVINSQLGYNGKWLTDFDFSSSNFCYDMIPALDNKIIQVGSTNTNEGYTAMYTYDFAIARWNADGSPDTSFNGCGRLVKHASGSADEYLTAAIQTDGKIIAAGRTGNSSTTKFIIDRYNTDGSVDTGFADQGSLVIAGVYFNSVTDIKVASDGKIYFSGARSYYKNCIISLNSNGSVNTGFGNGGKIDVALLNSEIGGPIEILPSGKILFATKYGSKLGLACFNTDGTADTTFGTNGTVIVDNAGMDIKSLVVLSDGKILVSGASGVTRVVRFNADGSLDASFGVNGIYNGSSIGIDSLHAGYMAVQPDNKIVIGDDNYGFSIYRINADGTFDTLLYDSELPYFIDAMPDSTNYVGGMFFHQGKLLIGGYSNSSYDGAFGLVRVDIGAIMATETPVLKENADIVVYPNPVTDNSVIRFSLKNGGKGSIILYDIMGKQVAVLAKDKSFAAGQNTETLNLPATLSPGVYIVNVKTREGGQNVKVIK